MRILETSNDFRTAIYNILQAKPRYLYLASYGLNLNSEFIKKLFKNAPKNTRLIIGTRDQLSPLSMWMKKHFDHQEIPTRFVEEFHGKIVVSDKGVIIGGRNLTDSEWEDYSFFSNSKKTIGLCKKAFENSWRRAK
jgi:hypothetical protein